MNTPLALRLTELALALAGAKDRLRLAVAEELGRVAASTLRDWVGAESSRLPVVRSAYREADSWNEDRRWDARDPWEEDRYEPSRSREDPEEESADDPAPGIPPAVAIGLGLWRWWLGRRGSWRGGLALGLTAGVLSVLGGPTLRAALAALAAATDLLTPTPLAIAPITSSR